MRSVRFEIWMLSEYMNSTRYGRVYFSFPPWNFCHQDAPWPSIVPLFPVTTTSVRFEPKIRLWYRPAAASLPRPYDGSGFRTGHSFRSYKTLTQFNRTWKERMASFTLMPETKQYLGGEKDGIPVEIQGEVARQAEAPGEPFPSGNE